MAGRFRLEAGQHDEPTGAVAFLPDGSEKHFGPTERISVAPGTRVEKTSKLYTAPAEFDSVSDLDKKFNQYDRAGRCVSRKFTRLGAPDVAMQAQMERTEQLQVRNENQHRKLERMLDSLTDEQLRTYAEGEEIATEGMSREELVATILGT